MANDLKHIGVLGMRWGHRSGGSGGSKRTFQAKSLTTNMDGRKVNKLFGKRNMTKAKDKIDKFLGEEIGLTRISDLKRMDKMKAIRHVTTVALATYGAFKLVEVLAGS